MRITECVLIDAPVEKVYAAFADLERWPTILPDTVGVDVIYDDGYNQEFSMTVTRPGGEETVRGFRYTRAPFELEMVQTRPPPLLSRMHGLWTFQPEGSRTRVVADRDFQLLPAEHQPTEGLTLTEEDFGEKLRTLLRANLQLFQTTVERDG